MTGITAKDIQNLRQMTGAGMSDCKSALSEAGGDFEKAKEILRIKGLNKVSSKGARDSSEGLVSICYKSKSQAAIVYVSSETDFVAKNDKFQNLVSNIAHFACENFGKTKDELLNTKYKNLNSLSDAISDIIASMGENIELKKVEYLSVDNGVIFSYIHNMVMENTGRIASLVAIYVDDGRSDGLEEIGKQIAMHVAAVSPIALTINEVSGEQIEREKSIAREQAVATGKPSNIIDKIIDGVQVCVVVGGGNILRGASLAESGFMRTTADYM
uniref:Elongation factor Ts, mitochondrial n=1 Tax=Biomphalaria glabrata TaxID=6526 RepID=A0A2C9L490_BIOGL